VRQNVRVNVVQNVGGRVATRAVHAGMDHGIHHTYAGADHFAAAGANYLAATTGGEHTHAAA
jgi:hypothetical protein